MFSLKGAVITNLLKQIQELKAQLAETSGTSTTHRHEIPLQQQINNQHIIGKTK